MAGRERNAVTPTSRQRAVLAYLHAFTERNGYPVSVRELCREFGWNSTHSAVCNLLALERKGLVRRAKKVSRGVVVTAAGLRALGVTEAT